MQLHAHAMQQTHTHKSVTGHVEVKQLLSHQRQSHYYTTTIFESNAVKMEQVTLKNVLLFVMNCLHTLYSIVNLVIEGSVSNILCCWLTVTKCVDLRFV